jgi:hypothetical protein
MVKSATKKQRVKRQAKPTEIIVRVRPEYASVDDSNILRLHDPVITDYIETHTLARNLSRNDWKQYKIETKRRLLQAKKHKSKLRKLDKRKIKELLILSSVSQKDFLSKLIKLNWISDLSKVNCKCGGKISLQKYNKVLDGYIWRCTNYKCGKRMCIRKHANFLFKRHNKIPLSKLLRFVFIHWWRMHTNDEINSDLNFAEDTISSLRRDLRIAISIYTVAFPYKFGSNGVVEIDELVLKTWGKNRTKTKTWIFGITERGLSAESKTHFYCEPMRAEVNYDGYKNDKEPNINLTGRNSKEVDRILFPRLIQGSVVMSDQHPMYIMLQDRALEKGLNIEHNIINKRQDYNILKKNGKPNLKIYTQTIENRWRLFRKILRKMSRIKYKSLQYTCNEISWRVQNSDNAFDAIGALFVV